MKVPQGWIFNTGWSLEFHRMPFVYDKSCDAACTTECEPSCNASCDVSCTKTPPPVDCARSPKESSQPIVAPPLIEPAPTLQKVEEKDLPPANESSFLMNIFKRRGRLGVCATCSNLGRFNDAEPQPAIEATTPVIAKFHPVPAAPVFCPEQKSGIHAVKPADFEISDKKKTSSSIKPESSSRTSKKSSPELPMETIPAPPPAPKLNKAEREPRELDVPPEPPDWVFTTPAKPLEKVSEAKKSEKSQESSPRR
jgi:hypothetical protein